ncbi:Uncharacterised protein [Mycobacteroides abscessus subsp. abscessus]|nr:Uncharacterised protein [Mycobacteroides abscessus subsp. abscessus]
MAVAPGKQASGPSSPSVNVASSTPSAAKAFSTSSTARR